MLGSFGRSQLSLLSVGNVVSTSVRIYRDRFQSYFRLALIAYLWILVPIYGWAKFTAISALISRLVFSEVSERPESVEEARRHVNPRLWKFLGAGILVLLIIVGFLSAGGAILWVFLSLIFAPFSQDPRPGVLAVVVAILLALVAIALFLIAYLRLICRLSVVDVPLAVEPNLDAISAVGRSWRLTKKFTSRIYLIIMIAFLVTLPFSLILQGASAFVLVIVGVILPADLPISALLSTLFSVTVAIFSNALVLPFWQAIRGILYYDLRSRREGIDLKLRNKGL